MIGLSKLIGKLVFVEFVELKMFQRVRRERIYPFRLGNVFIGGILNGKMLILFVGNGFIRSTPLIVSNSVG